MRSSAAVRGPQRNFKMRPRPTNNVRQLFLLARPLVFWRLSSLICAFQTRRPCQSTTAYALLVDYDGGRAVWRRSIRGLGQFPPQR